MDEIASCNTLGFKLGADLLRRLCKSCVPQLPGCAGDDACVDVYNKTRANKIPALINRGLNKLYIG